MQTVGSTRQGCDNIQILSGLPRWLHRSKIGWEGSWLLQGQFYEAALLNKSKEKKKVSIQGSGPFAKCLHAPLLDISKMHKEDNIQAIVSTPRPNLVLEEKARDQLKRAVEFH